MLRVGIGGWTYAPWRGVFFPPGLAHAEELAYASRHVTAIEVNGTFYRTQTPSTFKKWHDETPDDFVFTLKGPRYVSFSKEPAKGIDKFLQSGLEELGKKLGAILWQLPPSRRFEAHDAACDRGDAQKLRRARCDGAPCEARHRARARRRRGRARERRHGAFRLRALEAA
jgi:uncharacterized protein YecE (DUF72 family)